MSPRNLTMLLHFGWLFWICVPASAETLYVDSTSYTTIQEAIAAAENNDVIVVAPGTYNETIDFDGYAITLRSAEGPEVTIISGVGLDSSVIKCISGEGPDTVIEGFTITGGTGTPVGPALETRGGGMYSVGSSPTVRDCVFRGNAAVRGAGIYNEASDPNVVGCTFRRNNAEIGGAIHNLSSNPTLMDCTFIGNTADLVGAGINNWNSSPVVTHSMFFGNIAFLDGGGMVNWFDSHPMVTNCTFTENQAMDGAGMGSFYGASPTLTSCIFSTNHAGRAGGGMFNNDSDPTVVSCLFGRNLAVDGGGGMFNRSSSPMVTNCTFGANQADFSGGGAMFNHADSYPELTNCILWGNSPDTFAGSGDPFVIFSDVEGGFPGEGNIEVDPMFIDPQGGDFRLPADSPCVDGGDDEALPDDAETDCDGEPRIVGGLVDMGAYENQERDIPTVSTWGMTAMTLLMLVAGTMVFRDRLVRQPAR